MININTHTKQGSAIRYVLKTENNAMPSTWGYPLTLSPDFSLVAAMLYHSTGAILRLKQVASV